ncbi:hypothetical protein HZA42_04385 [Candidatus Peregrinibacteria bacterium]|nr:hypothetical protein [Candidatus Peregrinibacteria bacterium]
MFNSKKIGFVSLGVALVAAIPFVMYASPPILTVPGGESFSISLANGLVYTIGEASAATSVVVNDGAASFIVTTGSEDTIRVSNLINSTTPHSGKDIPNVDSTGQVLEVLCKPDGSSNLTIGPSKTVTITPNGTTLCLEGAGGGSSGGSGATTSTSSAKTSTPPKDEAKKPEVKPLTVDDLTDIKTLKNYSVLKDAIGLMVKDGLYTVPASKKFLPNNMLNKTFAGKVAVMVAKECIACTSTVNERSSAAKSAVAKTGRVSRKELLNLTASAMEKTINTAAKNAIDKCAKNPKETIAISAAKYFMTNSEIAAAEKKGVKGYKCGLISKPVTRETALEFAGNALRK